MALYTAVLADRAEVAALLIKHGADVNARPEYPAFSPEGIAAAKLGWQAKLRKLHIDGKATDADIKSLEPFPPTIPMLEQAAGCSHIATLRTLLAHHADMYPRVEMNQDGSKLGILPDSIINQNEDSIEVLLDHGYDPCRDFQQNPNPKHLTDAILAKRAGLSAPLVQRITAISTKCSAEL